MVINNNTRGAILAVFFGLFFGRRFVSANGGQNATSSTDGNRSIYMGGLFAFPDSTTIGCQVDVAQIALNHVNSLEGILDGYHLKMRWNWTGKADPEEGLRIIYNLAYTGPPVPILWGPLLAQEAIIVNQVAARFNIVQIGLPASPVLADRSMYPYTVRSNPTDNDRLEGAAAFITEMGWRRIAFIFEKNQFFENHMRSFRKILHSDGIQIVASERIKDIGTLDTHLQNLKRQEVRIIYTGFSSRAAVLQLFCQAYRSEMYGPKYVWIPPYWTTYAWWIDALLEDIKPCTQSQIMLAADTSIHFNINRFHDIPDVDYNGVKPLPEHFDYFHGIYPFSNNLVPLTYDNIIAIALALNASIADLQRLDPPRRLEDFTYSDEEMAKVVLRNADRIEFTGLTGKFIIKDGQRKVDAIYIDQAQGPNLNTVMLYKIPTKRLTPSGIATIVWKGGHVPVDGPTHKPMIVEVTPKARAILFCLAMLGSVLAFGFLVLNNRFKNKRAIKMSSPALGNLTIMGCLLLYTSVFATGWDKTGLSDTAIVFKCHLERILISLGMSLLFGSVFMKTYRIHAIFTVAVERFGRIDLPDWKLMVGVAMIVLVDYIIFTLWIILDQTTVFEKFLEPMLDMAEPAKEIFHVPVIRYCSSAHAQYFVIALYGVKGIMLTFGIFLAWETRNITISQLNDSKYIAASVYIVFLTSVLTLPAMALVSDDVNMTFLIPAIATVVVSTAVLCLHFTPKVYLLLAVEDKDIKLSMMLPPTISTNVQQRTSHGIQTARKIDELRLEHDQKVEDLHRLTKDLRRRLQIMN